MPDYSAIKQADIRAEEDVKILLVHGEDKDYCAICKILDKQSYKIFPARNGVQALPLYQQEVPDLIIIDIKLRAESGFSVAKTLKAVSPESLAPIIYISQTESKEITGKCFENGGVDVIHRPFDEAIVRSKITTYTSLSHLHRTEKNQRDAMAKYNAALKSNYEVAENVFRKVMHSDVLEMPAVKYSLSPISIFNGDILLAAFRPTGELHVFLGDFTGHGLAAAIGAIPVSDIFYGMTAKGFGITEIIQEINTKLKRILPLGLYLTTCMIEYDPDSKKVSFWNAGLPDVLLYNKNIGTVTQRFQSKSFPLGINDKVSVVDTTDVYLIEDGDIVLMYTDGVTEAKNASGEMYGVERLVRDLSNCKQESLIDYIENCVNTFVQGQQQIDDRTLLQVDLSAVLKNIEAKKTTCHPSPVLNSNWKVHYSFGPEILRNCDPLPIAIQTLMEIQKLHKYKQDIFVILKELFTNALDHGLLRLKSELKQQAEGFSVYLQEKQRRLQELEAGSISIEIFHKGHDSGGQVEITIHDTGSGFDVHNVLASSKSDAAYHGRGIKLVKSICDTLQYDESGSRVQAVYRWSS